MSFSVLYSRLSHTITLLVLIVICSSSALSQRMLTVSPNVVNFGVVPVGTTVTRTVTMQNVSNQNVVISALQVLGDTAFRAVVNANLPITIAPNQTIALVVLFTPTRAGYFTSTAMFTTNPANQAESITMSGSTGVSQITYSSKVFSFGDVKINTTSVVNLSIANSGNTNVTFYSARIGNNQPPTIFSIVSTFPNTVNAGTTVTVNISCSPVALGAGSELMYLSYGAYGMVHTDTFSLSCNGIQKILKGGDASGLVVRQPEKPKETISVGSSTSVYYEFENESANLITVIPTITGESASSFNIATVSPMMFKPGAKEVIEVRCTPVKSGTTNAILNIQTSAGAQGEIPISLKVSSTTNVQDNLLSGSATYPNPVSSILHITLPENSYKVEVCSLNGNVITTIPTNGTTANWNLQLPDGTRTVNGLYIVRVYSTQGISSGTVIVE